MSEENIININPQENQIPDYTLDELDDKENLSLKAFYFCRYHNLNSLNEIIDNYIKNKTFKNLTFCKEIINTELTTLCQKYFKIENVIENKIEFTDNEILSFGNQIPNYSLEKLRSIENLSVRAYNVCKKEYLSSLNDIINYYTTNLSFRKILNSGVKTDKELINLCNKHTINLPVTSKPEFSNEEKVIQIIKVKYGININDYFSDFHESIENKTIPIFKIIDIVLTQSNFLDEIEKKIINNIYRNLILNLEKIALISKLTRERIRQKKERLLIKLFHKPHGLIRQLEVILNDYIDWKYLKFTNDLIIVNKELIDNINKANYTNFSDLFITKILNGFNSDYKLIYNSYSNSDFLVDVFKDIKNNEKLKSFYLIKKSYNDEYILNLIIFLKKNITIIKSTDITITKHDILINNIKLYKREHLYLLNKIKDWGKKEIADYNALREKLIDNLFDFLAGKMSKGVF